MHHFRNMKTILLDAVNTAIVQNDVGDYVQFKELVDLLETYPNQKLIVTNANDEQPYRRPSNRTPTQSRSRGVFLFLALIRSSYGVA